jgi:hypothetical protein
MCCFVPLAATGSVLSRASAAVVVNAVIGIGIVVATVASWHLYTCLHTCRLNFTYVLVYELLLEAPESWPWLQYWLSCIYEFEILKARSKWDLPTWLLVPLLVMV